MHESPESLAAIDLAFGERPTTDEMVRWSREAVRAGAKAFAKVVNAAVPDGPEKEFALREVRQAMHAALDAIDAVPPFRPGPPKVEASRIQEPQARAMRDGRLPRPGEGL